MRHVRPGIALAATLLWATLGAAACEGDESVLGLTVDVYSPQGMNPYDGVSYIRAYVQGPQGEVFGSPVVVPYGGQGGGTSLQDLPYGAGRQVVVEGWTQGASSQLGAVVSRGRSAPQTVAAGSAAASLKVLISKVNAFSPLTSSEGGTAQSLGQGRVGHAITMTDRELVIVGGRTVSAADDAWWGPGDASTYLNSIEAIDLKTYTRRLHENPMFFRRIWHTATGVPSGEVFIAGGYAAQGEPPTAEPLKRVEVYTPGAGGPVQVLQYDMMVPRAGHTATLLDKDSFTILFVGGDKDTTKAGTFEVWNPFSGTITSGELPQGLNLRHHRATLFKVPGGSETAVIISGGETPDGMNDKILIYSVSLDAVLVHKGTMKVGRAQHTSTYVPGRNYVYMAGGFTSKDRQQASNVIDVYDIAGDVVFSTDGFALKTARGGQAATLMTNNSVLLSGGQGTNGAPLSSIEIIYEYLDPAQNSFVIDTAKSNSDGSAGPIIPFLPDARFGQHAAFLPGGQALLVGGVGVAGAVSMPTDLTFYNPE